MWQAALLTVVAPMAPELDKVSLFGFLALWLTALFWFSPYRNKTTHCIYAIGLFNLGVYGFLAGAWPLGVALSAGSFAQAYRLFQKFRRPPKESAPTQNRVERLFGTPVENRTIIHRPHFN